MEYLLNKISVRKAMGLASLFILSAIPFYHRPLVRCVIPRFAFTSTAPPLRMIAYQPATRTAHLILAIRT